MVRVWLPDRPGALGLVASRIGAVRGDVLAIDILERGGGQVVDELVVSLPAGTPQELLVAEIGAVDGVAVESVRRRRAIGRTRRWPCSSSVPRSPRRAPADAPIRSKCSARHRLGARRRLGCRHRGRRRAVPSRLAPDPRWLAAFLDGSGHLPARRQPRPDRRVVGTPPASRRVHRRRPGVAGRPRA